jgi:TonB family protein
MRAKTAPIGDSDARFESGAAIVRRDGDSAQSTRTRFAMGLSSALHVLLAIGIVFFPAETPGQAPITEIMLVDPGDLPGSEGGAASAPRGLVMAPPIPASPSSVHDPEAVPAAADNPAPEQRFARAAAKGLVAPAPGAQSAFADRLHSRLAAMQSEATDTSPRMATMESSPVATSVLFRAPAGATGGGGSGGKAPVELRRGGQGSGTQSRGTGTSGSASARQESGSGEGFGGGLAEIATAGLPVESPTASAQSAPSAETTAQRTLAGALLAGPIADRSIVSYHRPQYPEWAKHEGIGGSVTLYFVVGPDGTVKENIMVQKTAGFEDFDANAVQALSAWRFAPLGAGRTGDQWGTITFHFRLRDAG